MKRTGDMLLSGWKLLNSSCPVCNSAIMSKAGRLHCPGCDVPVMKEAEAAFMAKENANQKIAASPSKGSGDPVDKKPVRSLEEEKKAYDLSRSKVNMLSSKIGEYLLLGYTMLGDYCPRSTCNRVPLMQKKGENPLCISCSNHFVQDLYGALIPEAHMGRGPMLGPSVATAPDTTEVPAASSLTEKLAMFREKERATAAAEGFSGASVSARASFPEKLAVDPSKLIGEKLLQGWALLEDTCSSCHAIPLMQDKKKEVIE